MHDENKPLKVGPQEGLKSAKFRNRLNMLLQQLPQQPFSTNPKFFFKGAPGVTKKTFAEG